MICGVAVVLPSVLLFLARATYGGLGSDEVRVVTVALSRSRILIPVARVFRQVIPLSSPLLDDITQTMVEGFHREKRAVRKRLAVFSLIGSAIACGSSTFDGPLDGTVSHPLPPPNLGSLTIRSDTGVLVVGRRFHVTISAADASGFPVDASNTEVTSSNSTVAQLVGTIAVPAVTPPMDLFDLVASFDLTGAGSTAIRARLGLLTDSIVISVVPPT